MPVTIAIVDDNPIDRAYLNWVIKKYKNYKIIWNAVNGFDLILKMKIQMPQILILDMFMPMLDGLESIKILRNKNHDCKIICLSGFYDSNTSRQLKENGASVYTNKNEHNILNAINSIQKGIIGSYIEIFANNQKDLIDILNNEDSLIKINALEIQIINFLANGYNYSEIAEHLETYSVNTIEKYTHILVERFNLRNKLHLITFAYKNGLIYFNEDVSAS